MWYLLQDPNEEAPELEVPGTTFKFRVRDNMADREVSVTQRNSYESF